MAAVPSVPGDLDGDGLHTVLDLVVMLNHIDGTSRLSNEASVFADLNQDGIVNDADVDLLVDVILGISIVTDLPLTHILETSA